VYRHIFDRSNLDEVVAIGKGPDGKMSDRITRRADLEKRGHGRSDIVLFNGTRSGREYALYVTATGFAGDLAILDLLTDQEYNEVLGIAQRMRYNATIFPPASKLLG
jgi:hypothetical protein